MVAIWVYGALINVLGSVAINFGTNLLKFAHQRNDKRAKAQQAAKKNFKSRTWLIGISVFTIGNLCNFISFGFAAQSLLAGLGSVQFVTNVVFAHAVLKERVTRRVLLATFTIVAGNTFMVAFANQSSQIYSGGELFALYLRQAFVIYFIVLVIMVASLQVAYKRLVKAERENMQHRRMIPFIYALVSGVIGTQSVLLAKSVSVLLRSTVGGNNQLGSPFLYIVLLAWFATMLFWLYRMNTALRKFEGVFIIPMLQVVWILFSVLGGGIYFQEFAGLSRRDAFGFTLGVAFVAYGVYLLAPQEGSHGNAVIRRQHRGIVTDISDEELISIASSNDHMINVDIDLHDNDDDDNDEFIDKQYDSEISSSIKLSMKADKMNYEIHKFEEHDEFHSCSTSECEPISKASENNLHQLTSVMPPGLRLAHHRIANEGIFSVFSHDVMFGPFELANDWGNMEIRSSALNVNDCEPDSLSIVTSHTNNSSKHQLFEIGEHDMIVRSSSPKHDSESSEPKSQTMDEDSLVNFSSPERDQSPHDLKASKSCSPGSRSSMMATESSPSTSSDTIPNSNTSASAVRSERLRVPLNDERNDENLNNNRDELEPPPDSRKRSEGVSCKVYS